MNITERLAQALRDIRDVPWQSNCDYLKVMAAKAIAQYDASASAQEGDATHGRWLADQMPPPDSPGAGAWMRTARAMLRKLSGATATASDEVRG